MDDVILITELNDYIFCPASIYFHKLYGGMDRMLYQSSAQINGTAAHENVDNATYSTKKSLLMGIDIYCEKYGLVGKIDIYDKASHTLRERNKRIKKIYEGYVFQLEYKKTLEYASIFMEDILDRKEQIFVYVRSYYRAFMKEKPIEMYPVYNIKDDSVLTFADVETA